MNAHVLVVDDDEEIRASLRRGLAFEGFKVTLAADGEDALRSIRDDRPDLAVLKTFRPGSDGRGGVRPLRLPEEQLPVSWLPGGAETEQRQGTARGGLDRRAAVGLPGHLPR